MDIRPALKTGGSLALGVLALGAVRSGLALAMTPGPGGAPAGWAPMPDPADGGVPSPPFPANLTAGGRANLETFDALDFEVFSGQDCDRRDLEPPGHDGRGVLLLGQPGLLRQDGPGLTPPRRRA